VREGRRRRSIDVRRRKPPRATARAFREGLIGIAAALVLLVASPARASSDDSLAVHAPSDSLVRQPSTRGRIASRTPAPDSLGVHWEVGASTELSNEIFYEELFTDTTFLGRRLHGTPQSRVAGVAALELAGLRDHGTLSYAVRPEVTLGNQLTRVATAASARLRPDEHWRLSLEPRAEYSRDLGFGVERREVRLGSSALARRRLDNDVDAMDFRLSGDLLSTPHSNDPYLLAHRNGGGAFGWEHTSLLGWDWSAMAGTQFRTFPDSVERDHAEHVLEGSLHRELGGGMSLALAGELVRRNTLRPAASTRDRFVELQTRLTLGVRLGERYSLRGTLEREGYWYDRPDSSIDFDYAVHRIRLELRRELQDGLTLSLGPRLELLGAAWNAEERYREIAGVGEFELISGSRWWFAQPAAGWRAYESSSDGSSGATSLHSSFAFGEMQVFGDQALPARLRARVLMDGRMEWHEDQSQNSRSLYFSLDLRRLF
jgi:hypothetical protein